MSEYDPDLEGGFVVPVGDDLEAFEAVAAACGLDLADALDGEGPDAVEARSRWAMVMALREVTP